MKNKKIIINIINMKYEARQFLQKVAICKKRFKVQSILLHSTKIFKMKSKLNKKITPR